MRKFFISLIFLIICLSFASTVYAVNQPDNLKQYKSSVSFANEMAGTGQWINKSWIDSYGWYVIFYATKPGDGYLYHTHVQFELKNYFSSFDGSYYEGGRDIYGDDRKSIYALNMQPFGEGKYKWRARTHLDGTWPQNPEWSGWREYPISGSLTDFDFGIDTTPPYIASISSSTHPSPTTWYSSNTAILNWTGIDPNGSNASGGYYYSESITANNQQDPGYIFDISWGAPTRTYTSSANGRFFINLKAVDNAGNWNSAYSYREFRIDVMNPNIQYILCNGGAYTDNTWQNTNSNATFTVTSADSHSGLANHKYYWGTDSGGTPSTTISPSLPIGPLTAVEGTNYFRIQAVDSAVPPNVSNIETFRFKYDITPPTNGTASETGGAVDGAWTNNNNPQFNLTGSDSLSGLKGYTHYFGTDPSGAPSTYLDGTTIDPPGLTSDGIYYLRVKAKDNATNEASTQTVFTYKYDGTPPSGGFSALSSTKYYRGTIPLISNPSDTGGSGINHVEYYLSPATLIGTSSTLPNYTCAWNTTGLNGTKDIFLKIFDNTNNVSTTGNSAVKIDNYKPKTYALKKVIIKRGRTARLYWKVYDLYTGNKAYVTLKLQKRSGRRWKTIKYIRYRWTRINSTRYYRQRFTGKGTYRYLVYAKDQAGNTQYNSARNYVIVK